MLVRDRMFSKHPVRYLLCITGLCCLFPLLFFRFNLIPLPSGTSVAGFWCGVIAAGIIVFEIMLLARKSMRGRRLGATKIWMRWHIWLGLLSLPLVLVHCGYALGGQVSAAALIVFLIVIFSGVWGLCMQQFVPRRMLDELPAETIVHDPEQPMKQYRDEAETLLAPYLALAKTEANEAGAPARQKAAFRTYQLAGFFSTHVRSYLRGGRGAGRLLASPARSRELFADLRLDSTPELQAIVDRLEYLCDARRQLDRQAQLLRWLHYWLWVHTPLSIALVVLVAYHAVVALKFW